MGIAEAIAARLLELCRQQNITINMLSTRSAVRQSTVNDIVSGKTKNAGTTTLKKLCDGLDISITDFFNSPLFRNLEQEIK